MSQNGNLPQIRGENEKYLKPPPSYVKIWKHHPTETTIKMWLFRVPGRQDAMKPTTGSAGVTTAEQVLLSP